MERVTEPQGLSRVLWMPACCHCQSQGWSEMCQYSYRDITTRVPGEFVRPLAFKPLVLHQAMAAPQREAAASALRCAIFFPQECSSLSGCWGVGKHHKQKMQSPFVMLLNKSWVLQVVRWLLGVAAGVAVHYYLFEFNKLWWLPKCKCRCSWYIGKLVIRECCSCLHKASCPEPCHV